MEPDRPSILGDSKASKSIELEKDCQASAVEIRTIGTVDIINPLKMDLLESDREISRLSCQLTRANEKIQALEGVIVEMQSSVIWQLVDRYQRELVDPLLPHGTKRRRFYDKGIKGCRILLKGDWRTLQHKIRKDTDKSLNLSDQAVATPDDNSIVPIPQGIQSYPKSNPLVSIMMLAFGKSELTLRCMTGVLTNLDIPYELAVVHDGPDKEEFNFLSRSENLTVIRAKGITESVEACNYYLNSANGKYILFLGPGVEISPGSASAMINTMETFQKCGIVSGKLVRIDGRLDEAGCIAFYDGRLQSYGRGDDASLPDYSFLREIDCCSGLFALVKRDLFKELGGLNELYIQDNYRFADLCLGAEMLGHKVIYQPNAVAMLHDASILGGSLNKLNRVDRSNFKSKYTDRLEENKPFSHNALLSRDRRDFPRLLVIDDTVPAPYLGRGYPRASFMLKFFGEMNYRVTFLPLIDPNPWRPYTEQYQQMGIEVFCGEAADLAKLSESRAGYYDIVLVSRPHNMQKALPLIKKSFPCATLVYDAEALFSTREILKAEVLGKKMSQSNAQDMINGEIDLMKKSDAVITVSDNEMRAVMKYGIEKVSFWGHPVELMVSDKRFDEKKDILFVGAFADPGCPNEDAILYFIKEIFPTINKELSCKLFVVGFNKLESIKNIASPSIIVTGYVDSLESYYNNCRIFIVPHRYSTGIPWKLTEALGHGLPSVVSELTAQQLNLVDGKEVLVAQRPEEFAQKVIRLYKDKELWEDIQRNSVEYIKKNFDPEVMKEKLEKIMADFK